MELDMLCKGSASNCNQKSPSSQSSGAISPLLSSHCTSKKDGMKYSINYGQHHGTCCSNAILVKKGREDPGDDWFEAH